MAEQETVAVCNANRQFRKEQQAKDGAAAWKEYLEQEHNKAQRPKPRYNIAPICGF
jgi:hypothetical protein